MFNIERDGQTLSLYVDIESVSTELEDQGMLGVTFVTSRTFIQ